MKSNPPFSLTCRKADFIAQRFHPQSGFIPTKADLIEKDSELYPILSLFLVRRGGSDRTGYGQKGGAGDDRPGAGDRILRVGGGRYRDGLRRRGEDAGRFVVGVIGDGSAVVEDGNIGQDGIKGIGQHDIVGCFGCAAGVLNEEGVGQPPVFRNGDGGDRLGDGQLCRGIGNDRFRGAQRRDGAADRHFVDDAAGQTRGRPPDTKRWCCRWPAR